ncbi:late embryogenesis abundant protein 1-like isoform X1 [Vigna unguiculata]|uniref:Uncharacterized protein n=1 Tax=Vigna unguiculata TaxID=3917 RepID=A0A4D6MQI3_VIGUN|nr:late embryogenesis abundant protein 1-like isoform X1 [Vigna unguiculata]QCE02095.1 hypothetical protein DEO72_LG8g106 [Vigna unguiculata]
MASHDETSAQTQSDLTIMDQEKKNQAAKEKAQEENDESKERASEMGRCMKEWAQYGKENTGTGGFLQQTGKKVKEMAHGVSESVKNSFGMAPQNDDEDEEYYYYPTQHRRE